MTTRTEIAALSQKVRRDGIRIATILPLAMRKKKPGIVRVFFEAHPLCRVPSHTSPAIKPGLQIYRAGFHCAGLVKRPLSAICRRLLPSTFTCHKL